MKVRLCECEICGSLHPWDFDGDCRDDSNRFDSEEQYAYMKNVNVRDIEVRFSEKN